MMDATPATLTAEPPMIRLATTWIPARARAPEGRRSWTGGADPDIHVVVGYNVGMRPSCWWLAALALAACTPTHPIALTFDADRSEMARGGGILMNGFNEAGICHVLWIDGTGETLLDIDCDPGHRIFRVKPSVDGRSILYASNVENEGIIAEGYIQRVPLGGGVPVRTEAPLIHHDFVETPTGFAYLSFVEEERFVDGTWANLATDTVVHVREGRDDHEIRFDFLADYPVEPWWTCVHMRRLGWLPHHNEWTHTNSLVPHPTDDAWLLMPRFMDAIVKVDAATGEALWQLGGRDGRFELGDDDRMSHPHMSHAFDDRLLVFDNGTGHGPLRRERSRVVEYVIDEEALSAEVAWVYEDPQPQLTGFLGDAKRLPGGNTLISWSDRGKVTEVTPDGEIVWELKLPYGQNTGRVEVMGIDLPGTGAPFAR